MAHKVQALPNRRRNELTNCLGGRGRGSILSGEGGGLYTVWGGRGRGSILSGEGGGGALYCLGREGEGLYTVLNRVHLPQEQPHHAAKCVGNVAQSHLQLMSQIFIGRQPIFSWQPPIFRM